MLYEVITVNAYSQIGEYNEAVAEHDAKFEAQYANMDDATLKEMGQSVFIVQCAPCHGLQADGIDGKAANLNHRLEENRITSYNVCYTKLLRTYFLPHKRVSVHGCDEYFF